MITWIQTRFQTGYKILFFLVLVIVIVAFVFTVGDAPGMGRGGDRGEPQEYFGYNLRSHSDQQELFRLASMSFSLNYGRDPGQQLERYAFERLAYLGTGRDLGLPGPDAAQSQRFIAGLPAFSGQAGGFDRRAYQDYLDFLEADPRLSTADFVRVLEEDYIVAKVRDLLGGPGYAIPHDVKRQVARQKTEWTLELASVELTALDVEIDPDNDTLREFYENNDFRYEVPPHKSISYVVFETDRFLDRVETPSEDQMRAYFEANRGDFSLPEEAADNGDEEEDAEPREVRFEDVADEVEMILKRRAARRLAREAASDFTFSLFENEVAKDSEELAAKIDELDLERTRVEPFAEGVRPEGLGFSDALMRDIARLDETRFYSDPRDRQGDVVVALLDEIIPAYIPPFDDVWDRVVSDYRQEERRRLRVERGNEIYSTLNDRIAEGTPFLEAAEDLNMAAEEYGPFTVADRPEGLPGNVLDRLPELRQGEVSRMIQENSRAHFVHVVNRETPEVDVTSEEYVRNLEQTRNFSANVIGGLAVQEIRQRAMPRQTQPAR